MSQPLEKIKTYNQYLLALGGTLALLFFMVIGFIGLSELIPNHSNDHTPQGIIASNETDELLKDSLRKQIISFNNINIIDSTNQIYILPVRQSNLLDGESVDELLGLANVYGKGGRYFEKYARYKGATYNNLVIYESLTGLSEIIFDTRISISNYQVIEKDKHSYILITGTAIDSNKDEYLNRDDLQMLYVYDLKNKVLAKVKALEHFTTASLSVYKNKQGQTTDIIGHFGFDRNKNGEFQTGLEPMIFHKIDIKNCTLVPIIQKGQADELQKLLEGSQQ